MMQRVILLSETPEAFDVRDGALHPAEAAATPERVVAVVTGAGMALHRVELTETGERRRQTEAAMRAADLSADDAERLHVAIGAAQPDGSAWLAIAERNLMSEWLARLAAGGHDPDALVPLPLLLPEPTDGVVRTTIDGIELLRGIDFAGAVEPDLLPVLTDGRPVHAVDPLPALAALAQGVPLNLRQGQFRRRIRWWRDRRLLALVVGLALLCLLLALAPGALAALRDRQEMDRLNQATAAEAQALLGPTGAIDPAAALAARRAALTGHDLVDRLARLGQAVTAQPGARIARLQVDPGGRVTVSIQGAAGSVNAVAVALRATGQLVTQQGDVLEIAAAQGPLPFDALAATRARATQAQADAAVVRRLSRLPVPQAATAVRAAVAATGLPDAMVTPAPDGRVTLTVPAARSPVLMGMIGSLAQQRVHLLSGSITRNGDGSISGALVFQAAR